MNIRSPKNGFVIKLFVQNNETVKAGSQLLQMDSESEDRYGDHLDVLEGMRLARAAQYSGAELDLMRSLAQIAVDVSAARLQDAKEDNVDRNAIAAKGLFPLYELAAFDSALQQAKWDHEKALNQQQRLEFAVKRHDQLNDLTKKWNDRQKEFVAARKGHLRISTPTSGKVTLLVGEGSFAKYGNIIVEVK